MPRAELPITKWMTIIMRNDVIVSLPHLRPKIGLAQPDRTTATATAILNRVTCSITVVLFLNAKGIVSCSVVCGSDVRPVDSEYLWRGAPLRFVDHLSVGSTGRVLFYFEFSIRSPSHHSWSPQQSQFGWGNPKNYSILCMYVHIF